MLFHQFLEYELTMCKIFVFSEEKKKELSHIIKYRLNQCLLVITFAILVHCIFAVQAL